MVSLTHGKEAKRLGLTVALSLSLSLSHSLSHTLLLNYAGSTSIDVALGWVFLKVNSLVVFFFFLILWYIFFVTLCDLDDS